MLVLLAPVLATAGWFGGFRGPNPTLVQSQQQRFDEMSAEGAQIAVVYASRQLDEMSAVASNDKIGIDRRSWLRVGRVTVSDAYTIPAAILAQKALLTDSSRLAHQPLRPLTVLALSYASLSDAEAAEAAGLELSLGSFNCPNCGHFNDAMAASCTNCGAARNEYSPRGTLSIVSRIRGLTSCNIKECGFSSSR